jgi:hypothetical protein
VSESAGCGFQAALKGDQYPASTADLLANAERNGADADLLQTLENLPDRAV